jgi:hypothetical protein
MDRIQTLLPAGYLGGSFGLAFRTVSTKATTPQPG